jgi:hypothetical protein
MSYTITVEQDPESGCSIVSIPAGISTNASSPGPVNASFVAGTDVTLIATVGPGQFFNGWDGYDIPANIQTLQTTITFKASGDYGIKATFSNAPSQNLDIFTKIGRDYVPNQGERADAMHICQCPCACTGCSPAFTSALNRTRQTRALISGNCCQYYPVGLIGTTGGSGYKVGDILQLVGGTPLEQPALFKVIEITEISPGSETGSIREAKVIYGQPYRLRPDVETFVNYSGSGTGGNFAVLWASCLSPANLYRQ